MLCRCILHVRAWVNGRACVSSTLELTMLVSARVVVSWRQVVTDHMLIARQYMRSWFWIDLLGGFPIDWCFDATWEARGS